MFETFKQVKEALRQGPYAWPGGYPVYFITKDGAALSFEAVKEQFRQVVWDWIHDTSTGWYVVGVEVNWEDPELYCSHTNKRIESAYAESD